MKRNFLLEIGTEEMPAPAMPKILETLKEDTVELFSEKRLNYQSIQVYGTARRMVVFVEGLDEKAMDTQTEKRGPSLEVAFKNNEPTKALLGFARSQKVDLNDLIQKDGYVFAIIKETGLATKTILESSLAALITNLKLPNHMRWSNLEFKFLRPIRWIVALFGEEIIPFQIANLTSGRTSKGHRVLGDETFDIPSVDDYAALCEKEFVFFDQNKRKETIRQQIIDVAKKYGGEAEIEEDLLDEVTFLVEYPTALCGHFEEKYLSLPKAAIITPMRDHQRYFPVKQENGELLPLFITIRDGNADFLEIVQKGNERVLRARLADAKFFFDEDRKKSLEKHAEKLKTVLFQENLGSMQEKTQRLLSLTEKIADDLNLTDEQKEFVQRATQLSKADLTTQMVTEFTELQGVMGKEYALLDNEPNEVACAIDEQYLPRFAGDVSPETTTGKVLSLADKLDNLVSLFSIGKIPTGSQDPFGLRRQALAIARLFLENQWTLNLSELITFSCDLLNIHDDNDKKNLLEAIEKFMRNRLKNILDEENIPYDIAQAVVFDACEIVSSIERAKILSQNRKSDAENFMRLVQAFVRVQNLTKADSSSFINEALLMDPAEKNLVDILQSNQAAFNQAIETRDYAKSISLLEKLITPIDDFFEAVMIMDKDENIRENRLAILKQLDTMAKQLADFGKIIG